MTGKKWSWMDCEGRNEVDFVTVKEAGKAIFWPTVGWRERIISSARLSAEETFLSVSSILPMRAFETEHVHTALCKIQYLCSSKQNTSTQLSVRFSTCVLQNRTRPQNSLQDSVHVFSETEHVHTDLCKIQCRCSPKQNMSTQLSVGFSKCVLQNRTYPRSCLKDSVHVFSKRPGRAKWWSLCVICVCFWAGHKLTKCFWCVKQKATSTDAS